MHAVAPDSENVPLGQFEHVDAPELEANFPAVQFKQAEADVDAVNAFAVPGKQRLQASKPVVSPYRPVGQFEHEVLPVLDVNVPRPQAVQTVDPLTVFIVPTGQSKHAAMGVVSPYVPDGHKVQSVLAVSPGSPKLPSGQAMHTANDVAPVVAEYEPPGHRMQDSIGVLSPYRPAWHAEQDDAPLDAYEPRGQFVHKPADAPLVEPAGQFEQVSEPATAYFPGLQGVQLVLAVVS